MANSVLEAIFIIASVLGCSCLLIVGIYIKINLPKIKKQKKEAQFYRNNHTYNRISLHRVA